ncbi:MAG: NPCBM/NEW2 domain-containing protein, partial [Gemmataceae bacterium]|nr:NPCBM/NEW2 domain-containing protein [Gemmataceae bacterium]
LGVEEFESNVDVIENAADQRMQHVRSFQNGPHGEVSQRLLNEITAAKLCLLNVGKKAEYDRKLRADKDAAEPRRLKPMPRAATGEVPAPAVSDESMAAGESMPDVEDYLASEPAAGGPFPTFSFPPLKKRRGLSPQQAAIAGATLGLLLIAVVFYVTLIRAGRNGEPAPESLRDHLDDTPAVVQSQVEPGDSLPAGVWCDVLPWVDVSLDAVSGQWQSLDGQLEGAQSEKGKVCALPLEMEGDYRLAVEFTCQSPGGVEILIPVAGRWCNVELGAFSGLFWVDGRHMNDNGTGTDKHPVVIGQRHRAEIEVTRPAEKASTDKASVRVTLDGESLIDWQGSPASLSGWDSRNRVSVGAWDAQVRFHRVQVQLVSGTARRLSRAGKTAENSEAGAKEHVWIDDAPPAGVELHGAWEWVSQPAPVFSGAKSMRRSGTGIHEHFFLGANPRFEIGQGDRLFAHVYLDPKDPPKAIMLQVNDSNYPPNLPERYRRAYWGEDVIPYGEADTASRRRMGALPKTGEWVRLEVPVERLGLAAGSQVHLWGATQFGGTAYWDRAGIAKPKPLDSSETVYLDDLQEQDSKVGGGILGKHGDRGFGDKLPAASYQGEPVPHALAIHPPARGVSYVVYQLNGEFAVLRAIAALLEHPGESQSHGPLTFKVLGDDRLLWESRNPLQRLGAGESLVVNVQGVKTLKLEVHCPGSNGHAYAAWLMPALSRPPPTAPPQGGAGSSGTRPFEIRGETVYLDDAREEEFKVGIGTLGKQGQRGHDPPEVLYQGKKVPHALAMHPPQGGVSHVVYQLNGQFSTLRAMAAIQDVPNQGQAFSPLTFKVVGDGKLLWQSSPLQRLGTGEPLAVNVEGVQTLRLEVHCPGLHAWAHAAWLMPMVSRAPRAGAGVTSLANAAVLYRVPEEHYAVVRAGDVEAVVVDNEPVDNDVLPGHRLGYHGVASLKHKARPANLFVPSYCGLHLASIYDGTNRPVDVTFEPRRTPMELRVVSDRIVELYQKPTPAWGLESAIRYHLLDDGVIEMTFECIPRQKTFTKGYIGSYFASYFNRAESPDMYFLGRSDGAAAGGWVRAVSPAYAELATHLAVGDQREFSRDTDFPLPAVVSYSKHRYDEPWFYGGSHGMAFVQMFRQEDQARFTQLPIGGGQGNPEWAFNWLIPNYEVGKLYRLVMRAMYVPLDALHLGLVEPHLRRLNGGGALPAPSTPKAVFLDDLTEVEFKVGVGTLGKRGERGYTGQGVPDGRVLFQGCNYAHALSTHPASGQVAYVVYQL